MGPIQSIDTLLGPVKGGPVGPADIRIVPKSVIQQRVDKKKQRLTIPPSLAMSFLERMRRDLTPQQKKQVKATSTPPEWQYLDETGTITGLRVRAWTIGEARAECKKIMKIPKTGRLPVGATVRLVPPPEPKPPEPTSPSVPNAK